jgi:hypothetical protein
MRKIETRKLKIEVLNLESETRKLKIDVLNLESEI